MASPIIVPARLRDFWYGHAPTLYFELETVFANANQGKQVRSWRNRRAGAIRLFALRRSVLQQS